MKKIKFNLPTKLTFVRLILSLIIIILLIFPFYRVGITFPQFLFKNILIDLRYLISGVLFIIASITDYYDGKLARKNNEVTNFGKLVDAIADKVLVNSVLIIFACQGFISAVVPVVIIVSLSSGYDFIISISINILSGTFIYPNFLAVSIVLIILLPHIATFLPYFTAEFTIC